MRKGVGRQTLATWSMYLCNNVLVCCGKYIKEFMSPWSGSKVTGKVSKEKCHFLDVGRRACVQELEASQ